MNFFPLTNMRPEDWKSIKATLNEALALEPAARSFYLENANVSNGVRAEVESLLLLESEAQNFMSVTASGFAHDLFDGNGFSTAPLIKQQIGIYEIVSELGFGGMGAVYLARRVDGKFEQRVAIKLLRREFNTEKLRRTFEREKKILAALAHPNIATLLDAGTTEDGIPYLVMEYVQGEPIDQFCKTRSLSLNARLKLFNKVCDAVAFAHRNLIVHRDLKPPNILVNKDGEPKLLDFGISKLLDAESDDATNVTQLGALTPQYASPEQLRGEPVTTATDVYSLGVILFTVLTENLPYRVGKKSDGRLHREIRETAPALPSEAALKPSTRDQLKGDLDNIVLKALRKEPEGRYQTVQQLSADIWRFIDGLPVVARPATLSYRARKFYGRNKVPVWAAALIVVSLLAGIGIALYQAKAAREQARIAADAQRKAELETERAKAEEQKAQRTTRFLQSFLENANPNWYARGKGRFDVTLREAIDDAAGRIDTELADEPEVRADLHYTMGEMYRVAAEYEISLKHFRQSLDLYRKALGEPHPKVARGLYYYSMALNYTGSPVEEVEPLLRNGIAMMRQTEPNNVNLPYMLQTMAGWLMRMESEPERRNARLTEAENLLLEAKTLFLRHYGENHSVPFTADFSLAMLAHARGDMAKAESIHEANLKNFSEGHATHLSTLVHLAEVKFALGKRAEAEALLDQARTLGQRQWRTDDPRLGLLLKNISRSRGAANK